jgi:two-component sensor histidine kinase
MMVMLLPMAGMGQALTHEALQQINRRLAQGMADTTRVRLLLAISAHATTHADRSTARDSALRFAKEALALSTKIHYDSGIFMAHLKEVALWANVYERALAQSRDTAGVHQNKRAAEARLIAVVKKTGSPNQMGEAYMSLALLHEGLTDYAEMLMLYDSAAAWFRRSGNALRESYALYGLGFNYNQLGKLKESLPIYHRSITLAEPTGGVHLFKVYGILGHAYSLLGGYNLGLKYELKGLQLAEALGDTTFETSVLHLFIGLAYDKLKNYPVAREHFEKAYRIGRHYIASEPGDFFYISVNLARVTAMTNPQEAIDFLIRFKKEYGTIITPFRAKAVTTALMQSYEKLHNYAMAQRYCQDLIVEAEAAPRPFLPDYMAISQFMVLSQQYHAAEKYLTIAEQISKEQRRMPNLQNIYLYWFKVDSARGNYGAAIEKFRLHKAYSDSMLNDIKTKEVALLEIEYETAKKEQSIAFLTKDSELGRQQLAQSRFQKNVILAGLAVAVLISGLLFMQYRTKKKNNTELTRRQQAIQTTNELLQKTILEKEWLLKEVHHRVKNNLQTVVGLLGSQLYLLQNTEAASAIHDSQNRVHAMSLIHQKLYLTEHRTSINMAGYLGELTEYLRDSFPSGRAIQFQLYIQAIELDVSQAIPVGLIINEAITNVIKYAFPSAPKEDCRVVVSMQEDAARNVLLTISDNGKGLPADFDSSRDHFGLGLRLMHGLASEIDGRCKISSNHDVGVLIEITFKASALLE